MFDLDVEVRRWRARQERKSSLAAAELDELEDHLRARVDLELELMTVPSRRRAFALACARLGESAALSREFAKAGTPRWRKLLIAGWAMFGASFLMPVTHDFYWGVGPGARQGILWGWQALVGGIMMAGDASTLLSGWSNALILATLLKLGGRRPPKSIWLAIGVVAAALLNLQWLARQLDPGIGYWAWVASFACIGSALWMHAREGAPARLPGAVRASGHEVVE